MAHAVVAGEVEQGLAGLRDLASVADQVVLMVCQENGTGLRIAFAYVAHAAFLFLGAGVLVLLDGAVQVIVDGGAGNQAGLRAAVHGELVHVELRLLVADEDAIVLGGAQKLACLGERLLVRNLLVNGEVHLWLVDGQKRLGVLGYDAA